MAESINSIKFNSAGIQGSTVSTKEQDANNKQSEETTNTQQVTTTEVSEGTQKAIANAQVSYALAGIQINSAKAKETENVATEKTAEYYLSKLTPEKRAELESNLGVMMEEFESSVVNWFKKCEEELGANFTNLPEDEQMALAASAFAHDDEE